MAWVSEKDWCNFENLIFLTLLSKQLTSVCSEFVDLISVIQVLCVIQVSVIQVIQVSVIYSFSKLGYKLV